MYTEYKEKIQKKFSDAVYDLFLTERYGITPCCSKLNIELFSLQLELLEYEESEDADAI